MKKLDAATLEREGQQSLFGPPAPPATAKRLPGSATTQYDREPAKEDTARNRVHRLLWTYRNEWVRATLITAPEYGGSEGLRRVRELRNDGALIRQQKRPGSTEREYMLVVL